MSIPANKADNETKAYDIKLKRTRVAHTDASIKDGILEYGEPLYNDTEKTFAVGDGQTPVASLKVTKLVDKSKADTTGYFSAQTNNMVTLQKEDNTAIYPKTKFWTSPDSSGISRDSRNNVVCIDFTQTGTWYKVKSDGTKGEALPYSDRTTVPRIQTITVSGVLATDKVSISLCPTNAERLNIANLKKAEKVFATLYDVDSVSNGINIYCKKVRDQDKCYLNVFGG